MTTANVTDIAIIDPRLKRLSHSGAITLHRCPRKFQLQKIARVEREQVSNNVTLTFGTIVGIGIQEVLANKSWNEVVMAMFLAWDMPDLFDEEDKTGKGFFSAIYAIQVFQGHRDTVFAEYELAYFKGKPAVELSLRITMPDGFTYRGFVDIVLRHKTTGKLLVVDAKTTGSYNVEAGTYKNSSQAIGYSIILDAVAPGQSDYEVWYLVYMTRHQRYEILPFTKYYNERAMWIQDLVLDVERIKSYEAIGHYPKYGESCRDYMRDCEFLQTCNMHTQYLEVPYDPDNDAELKKEYTFDLTLLDIVNAQLEREGEQ